MLVKMAKWAAFPAWRLRNQWRLTAVSNWRCTTNKTQALAYILRPRVDTNTSKFSKGHLSKDARPSFPYILLATLNFPSFLKQRSSKTQSIQQVPRWFPIKLEISLLRLEFQTINLENVASWTNLLIEELVKHPTPSERLKNWDMLWPKKSHISQKEKEKKTK